MPKCEHVNLLRLGVNYKAISSICFNMLQLLRLVNYEPNRYNNGYLFFIKGEKMTEQKKVIIHLHTEIDDAGEKEFISERHEGTYFKKEDKAVLLYTDRQNEMGEIKNFITVQPDKLSVKRSGVISMQQIFHVGRQTECMYKHPYGSFLMEIKTISLETASITDTSGEIVAVYDMLFQNTTRRYTLTIDFEEV